LRWRRAGNADFLNPLALDLDHLERNVIGLDTVSDLRHFTQALEHVSAQRFDADRLHQEAIMLDHSGMVSEASGENIFVVRDGVIATPPAGAILDGITRKSVIQIAHDFGYDVIERPIAPSELTFAEEVFLTGTAAELVPVRSVDDHELGEPGEITRQIQSKLDDALHGRAQEYLEWLDIVEQPSKVTS